MTSKPRCPSEESFGVINISPLWPGREEFIHVPAKMRDQFIQFGDEKAYRPNGLQPDIRLNGTALSVIHEHLLMPSEKEATNAGLPDMLAEYRNVLALLPEERRPPAVALHAFPKVDPAGPEGKRRTIWMSISPRNWPRSIGEGMNIQYLVPGWQKNMRLLSFLDPQGIPHLPMDFFNPTENAGLRDCIAAQAILAAQIDDSSRIEDALQEHGLKILRESALFDWPSKEQTLAGVEAQEIFPFLAMNGLFEKYWKDVINDKGAMDQTPGTEQWTKAAKLATLRVIKREIYFLFPEGTQEKEEMINGWMPPAVQETVKRAVKNFTVDLESVSLEDLRLAIRNLFAFRMLQRKVPRPVTSAPEDVSAALAQKQVLTSPLHQFTRGELLRHMLRTNRTVCIQSSYPEYFRLIPVLTENIQPNTLIVFSTRLWLMNLMEANANWLHALIIETAVNDYIRNGESENLNLLPRRASRGESDEVLEALLQRIRTMNAEERANVHYAAALEDQHALIAHPVSAEEFRRWASEHAAMLRQRADEAGAKHILIIESPFGATKSEFRKPNLNAQDIYHEELRRAFPSGQLDPADGQPIPDVEIALHHTHHIKLHQRASVYDGSSLNGADRISHVTRCG
jgi:hypothetical protein